MQMPKMSEVVYISKDERTAHTEDMNLWRQENEFG